MGKTLWILSEERPKVDAITHILQKFSRDSGIAATFSQIKVFPVKDSKQNFSFWYEIVGYSAPEVDRVLLRIVSGNSSFIDFLVFFQESEPQPGDRPLFMTEETKTDDEESRNTGVYQRCSKFVYAELHYPKIDMNMFYNLHVEQRASQTDTNIFGTRCLHTLGVTVSGKELDDEINRPFSTLEELIAFKSSMRKPPAGNVPIDITVSDNKLFVSGRLVKSGALAHDPNIGALSLIGATARKLGWTGEIIVTQHGLLQSHVQARNKFVRIANVIGMKLEGLHLPKSTIQTPYWDYNTTGEKLASIFLHLIIEQFTSAYSIFENHAGSEKGYFITPNQDYLQLEKYVPDSIPRKSIDIPDLIIYDGERDTVLNIEGKTFENKQLGIDTLDNYDDIEGLYIEKYYPKKQIGRYVVLFGGSQSQEKSKEVMLLLNERGEIIVGSNPPKVLTEALTGLRARWSASNFLM